jgi:hypothetical protein
MTRVSDLPSGPVKHDEPRRRQTHSDARYLAWPERDRIIVALANRGWTHKRIAAYPGIGLSRRGVGMALERISEGRPGRDPRA